MLSPVKGSPVVTRPFGEYDPVAYANYPGKKHPGVDIQTGFRLPLYAVTDGTATVIDRGTAKVGRGREVRIVSGNTEVRYCHLDEIVIKNGQVKAGDLIGYSGWTGYVLPANEKGSHLHFEVLINGAYVNPMDYINKGEVMDLNLARQQADAQWGWSITPERDAILNRDIVGRETNEAINFMYNHPWGVNWRTYRNQLQQFWNDYHEKIVSGKLDDDDAEMQAALAELNKAKELLQKAIED